MSATRDWSVFDRPELADALGPRNGADADALLALDGMHCANCAARAERVLAGTVDQIRVNVAAKTVSFRWQPARTRISAVLQQLDDAGLGPRVLAQEDSAAREKLEQRRLLLRLGVATICAMQVMMLAWPSYSNAPVEPGIAALLRWTQWLIAVPGVLWAGWPFFSGALHAAKARVANMDVTIALALLVAFGASTLRVFAGHGDLYLDTATMFVWLLLLGRWLEGRTRRIAGERLRLLAGRRALTARRLRDGQLESVPIGTLQRGDIVQVDTGEALPADADLLDAAAELDESLLTGESRPVAHRAGEALLAGSLNTGAVALRARVSRTGSETTLAQITALLDRAQAHRPTVQRIADRIAGRFVLAIVAIAAATFAWRLGHGLDAAIDATLAVLVASCPCALSLAVPIVLASASSRLAGAGVLVANPDALPRLATLDTALFDKTGTLTTTRLALRAVEPLASAQAEASGNELLALAAALERDSRHPIATAIRDAAQDAGLAPPVAEGLAHRVGGGIEGRIGTARYALLPAEGGAAGETPITLQRDGEAIGRLTLIAPLRPEAVQAVQALAARGLSSTILSGDAHAATEAAGREVGAAQAIGRLQPAEKLARLQALRDQGRHVLAVGDGFNDAPLLAAADVSAALPHGAALTQAKADLVLVGDSLLGLPAAIDIARAARRRVRENLMWALGYNLLVLPLAASGHLAPWMAAAGMSASSLLVAVNALRLRTPLPAAPARPEPEAPACPVSTS